MELAAKGEQTSVLNAPIVNFSRVGADLSAGVSVLGTLSDSSLAPSDFARAADNNWLSVFFTPGHAVGSGGSIWLQGPSGFDFGENCQVKDLPAYHYGKFSLAMLNTSSDTPLTMPLPFLTCTGASLPVSISINLAKIQLSSRLFQGSSYGFMLHTRNPSSYFSSQKNGWYLSTYSPSAIGIDGSLLTLPFNAGDIASAASSWGMYEYNIGPSGFEVHIADMRPSGSPTRIRVFPISLFTDTSSNFRILAPAGYTWNFSASEFIYLKHSAGSVEGTYVAGAEADLPISAPPVAPTTVPYNVLEFTDIAGKFRWGVKYGFEAKIVVPQYTPTSSVNSFVLQVGYNDSESSAEAPARSQAALVEAVPVRRITDVVVAGFSSSVVNESNVVVLRFRTQTEIPEHGGFAISAPSDFQPLSNVTCQLKIVDEHKWSLPMHACRLGNFSGVGADALASVLAVDMMPATHYEIHIPVQNSVNATLPMDSAGLWRITAYESLDSMTQEILDYEGSTSSFRISKPMQQASIVSGKYCIDEVVQNCAVEDQQYRKTGRNDRPGARNNLVFSVNVSSPSEPGKFIVYAPEGFTWKMECEVVTASSEVFGLYNELPAGFSEWPENATVSDCRGHENIVMFQVSHPPGQGLLPDRMYTFRIDWVTNPATSPVKNEWIFEFSGQASLPFSGFTLWALAGLTLTPHTTSRSVGNNVVLSFATFNAVPVSGYVQITAPGGFVIPHTCTLTISTAIPAQPWEANKLFYPEDYNCTGVLSNGNPTNVGRIFLLRKSLLADLQYIFDLNLRNPSVASTIAGSWEIATFWKVTWITSKATYEQLDTAMADGFMINNLVGLFELRPTPKLNGFAAVRWQFSMIFREAIFASDRVELQAPTDYFLQESMSSTQCSEYELVLGLHGSNTSCNAACYQKAVCVNSTIVISFHRCPSYEEQEQSPMLDGLCLREDSSLQFSLA